MSRLNRWLMTGALLLCACVEEAPLPVCPSEREAVLEVGIEGSRLSCLTKTSELSNETRDCWIFMLNADNGTITHRYYFDSEKAENGIVYSDIDRSSNAFAKWQIETASLSNIRSFEGNVQLVMVACQAPASVLNLLPELANCRSLSDLEQLVVEDHDALQAASPLYSGYCRVSGQTIFHVNSGLNTLNGSIELYPMFSENTVRITSLENRFSLASFRLVDLPAKTFALSSAAHGWADFADESPLPLQSTAESDAFTKTTSTSGEIAYSFSFKALERKGLNQLPNFSTETAGIASLADRNRYATETLATGLSSIRVSYLELNGVYRGADGILYGLKLYVPLGDVSQQDNRSDWADFDILRGKRYLYHLRINGIGQIEQTVADFPYLDYFRLTANAPQTFAIDPLPTGFDYKLGSDGHWTALTSEALLGGIEFGGVHGTLYLRGRGGLGTGASTIAFGKPEVEVSCAGDLRTLVDWYDWGATSNVSLNQAAFTKLFYQNEQLVDASGLIFPSHPAKPQKERTYESMFEGCTALVSGPVALPSQRGSNYYYYKMFKGCTNLTTAPTVDLEWFEPYCCSEMFMNCSSLTEFQDNWVIHRINTAGLQRMFAHCTSLRTALRSTVIQDVASSMFMNGTFQGCTSLVEVFESLPAPLVRDHSYNATFENCTSLVTAPSIGAMYHRDPRNTNALYRMFAGCTSLENAPAELKIIAPQTGCYQEMFAGCTRLSKAPVILARELPDSIKFQDTNNPTWKYQPQTNAFKNMFKDCPLTEIELLHPNLQVNASTDYVPFDTNDHWPNDHWYSNYQDFNIVSMKNSHQWATSGTIWVKTEAIKASLDASNHLVPTGWTVQVKP